MERTQVYTLVNNALKQTVGDSVLLEETLTNVVDVGTAVFDNSATEQFTKALIDQIGRVKVMAKEYKGRYPKILREAWEYGSVLMTIKQTKLPQANENESWELEGDVSYDPNILQAPSGIEVKYFGDRIAFEIPYSLVNYQLKEAFQSANQLSAFIGMLVTNVNNAMEIALGNLARRCVNNLMGVVLGQSSFAGKINLLSEYETVSGQTLTAAKALYDKDFLRYAAFRIGEVNDRLKDISELYNVAGVQTFSTDVNTVYLSDFKRAMGIYLYNAQNQFKDGELVLPEGEVVPFWQGSGTDYAFDKISKIDVKANDGTSTAVDVAQSGILAVQFDMDAAIIACLDRHTTSHYNARAEFTNYWDKATMGILNDFSKNTVVYYIAD